MSRLTDAWGVIAKVLPDLRDLHVYGGAALVTIGAALVYPPAGWMVAGLCLIYLGLRRR